LLTSRNPANARHARFVPQRSIRCAKDTGPRNFPLQGCAQNQIWAEIAAMASELLGWMAI